MKIVILTGAGISAESGISTFRDTDGLWNNHNVQDVATLEGYHRNPDIVRGFYSDLRTKVSNASPNAAHYAVAKLQKSGHDVTLVTQNIDDLHEEAGSPSVLHMHGSLDKVRCDLCNEKHLYLETLNRACPFCGGQTFRPDVVWFGEQPYHLTEIDSDIRKCNMFISIGTSGNVYPAAGFAKLAVKKMGYTIEFNTSLSENSRYFKERILGKAGETFPVWVDKFIETTKCSN